MNSRQIPATGRGGRPLWRQITDALIQEIEAGTIPPGTTIPSEAELVARYDVSRFTVRQAIARLREQGLIDIAQGRGAFVRGEVLQYTITERTRFAQNLELQGFEAKNEFLSAEKVIPPAEISNVLNIGASEPVWRINGLSFANGEPLSLGRVFHPAKRFPDIVDRRRKTADTATVYAGYGIENYSRLSTWISTRMPQDEEAEILKIDVLDPVIISQKIDIDADGVPIEYNETIFSGRRTRLHFPTSPRSVGARQSTTPPAISKTLLDR